MAEKTRGRGKGSSRKLSAAAIAAALAMPGLAAAAPLNGQLIAGNGSIAQAGAVTTITQLSPNLSLNWKSFNVAPQESVNFIQPSAASIAVNRITDTAGSQILGKLHANGQVFLINPNGILFGANAQVNVGGLVASTLDISDANLNSNSKTFSGNGSGSVINQGAITAANGGYVALLANHVGNSGVIQAQLGAIALGAGSAATLTFAGNSLVQMQVDQSVLNSLAENGGLLQADGGTVLMKAGARDSLLASVVNNTGVIQAHGVAEHDGMITLLAGMTAGVTHVDGTLDASAAEGGKGGFIETSAAHVNVTDKATITTAAAKGSSANAGTWLIDPADFIIAASGGNITGAALTKALLTNNQTIYSTGSKTGTNGDINVNDMVKWSKNTLTLNAQQNVNINADLIGSNKAQLALIYGQSSQGVGNFYLNNYARINLSAGQNFTTKLGTASTISYTVITSIAALQSLGDNSTIQGGAYALGDNIPALETSRWNNGLGFKPIGSTAFNATFDGLGHIISSLTINRPGDDNVGLFGTADYATIRNVGLVDANINGNIYVGALAGTLVHGKVVNSYVTGHISGYRIVGGLVGYLTKGGIDASYVNASVLANIKTGDTIGGLVGAQDIGDTTKKIYTYIKNSYAVGSVAGSFYIGGLAGISTGNIFNSYAATTVKASNGFSGGLIGYRNDNSVVGVFNSYWNSDTSSQSNRPSGTGITTSQMRQAGTFNDWDSKIWTFTGNNFPILTNLISRVTVTANSFSKTYDGVAYIGTGTQTSQGNNVQSSGIVSYSGTAQNDKNAGTYKSTGSGLITTDQQTAFTYVDGTLNVTRKAVDISSVGRTYDGTSTVQGTLFKVSNTVKNETLKVTGKGNLSSGTVDPIVNGDLVEQNMVHDYGTLALANDSGGLASNYILNKPFNTNIVKITPKAITVTATADTKIYNGTNIASVTLNRSGVLFPDSVTATNTSATFDTKNVGTKKIVTVSGLALTGNQATNYSIANANTTTTALADITKKGITLTVSGADKTYDGISNANGTLTPKEKIVGDDLTFPLFTGNFDNKNVGSTKKVTMPKVVASGLDKDNYKYSNTVSGTASITALSLPVVGTSVTQKTYDGNTNATLSGGALSGVLGKDSVMLGAQIGTFDKKDVDTVTGAVKVNVSDTISGTDAGNYALQQPKVTGVITPKTLNVTSTIVTGKTYDGNTNATLSGGVLTGFIGTEGVNITLNQSGGTFKTKDVDPTGAAVSVVANDSISGTGSGNYKLAKPSSLSAVISPKGVTVIASGINRTYDGTLDAKLLVNSTDTVATDVVNYYGTATFSDKVAKNNKILTNLLFSKDGADAGNYFIKGGPASATATISPKNVTLSPKAQNREYNSTTDATVDLNPTGVLPGDVVILVPKNATFSNKNAELGKTVTFVSIGASGIDLQNYNINNILIAKGDITPKVLTPVASAAPRDYNGTNKSDNATATADGILSSDSVGLSVKSAIFDKKDAGMQNLTANGIYLTGNPNDIKNYSLKSTTVQTTAMINTIALTVSGSSVSDKVYDGSTSATVQGGVLSGVIGNDFVKIAPDGNFGSKNVGNAVAVNLNDKLTGTDQANYTVTQQTGLTANISQKSITVTATGIDKAFDGTDTAKVKPGGQISTDTVRFDYTAKFVDANVGNNKIVNVSGITKNSDIVTYPDNINYNLINSTASTTATITP